MKTWLFGLMCLISFPTFAYDNNDYHVQVFKNGKMDSDLWVNIPLNADFPMASTLDVAYAKGCSADYIEADEKNDNPQIKVDAVEGTIQTGFHLLMKPYYLTQDDKIIVKIKVDITDLVKLQKFNMDDCMVQLPQVKNMSFETQAVLTPQKPATVFHLGKYTIKISKK